MGVSYSWGQVADKFAGLALDLPKEMRAATVDAVKVIETELRIAAAAATGGDLVLSRVGKNGARLGVRHRIYGGGAETTARILASGPWQLVEHTIAAHLITSKKAGGSRRSRQRRWENSEQIGGGRSAVILTPYGPRAWALHPGVANVARPWALGTVAGAQKAPAAYSLHMTKALADNFR